MNSKTSRRKFIKDSAFFAVSVSAFGFVSCSAKESVSDNQNTADCQTTSDILGPYYREGAPLRSNLTFTNQAGTPLIIKGIVYSEDCITILDKATVETVCEDFLIRGMVK